MLRRYCVECGKEWVPFFKWDENPRFTRDTFEQFWWCTIWCDYCRKNGLEGVRAGAEDLEDVARKLTYLSGRVKRDAEGEAIWPRAIDGVKK
jgi:hypothetical protein